MADWNAGQYLKFKTERTQPAIDLARSMELQNPSRIADIGCGPGNSTAVLCAMFPQAKVTGYDSSADMLKAARENCPEAEFKFCDVSKNLSELGTGFDVVFSNACLQWVPEHRSCIPGLLAMLKPGGVLAVQIPNNFREPIHRIISAAVTSEHHAGGILRSACRAQCLLPHMGDNILPHSSVTGGNPRVVPLYGIKAVPRCSSGREKAGI